MYTIEKTNEVVSCTRLNFCRFPARFSIFSTNAPIGCCRNMSFWHSIFKTSDTSAVDVLYLQRWNFYTSTSNVNLCCIGHLGKHGKRGKKRKNCIFMIFEERRRCRCTIHCGTMNAYVSCVSNTPFFFENGVWEDVFLSMCFTWLTCILYFPIFWLIEICFD